MITLREMFILWAEQYDWSVLRKVTDAIQVGITLGIILDLIVWFIIKF